MSHRPAERLLLWTLRGAAALSGALLLAVMVLLVRESVPALRNVGLARFFGDAGWHPAGSAGSYGLAPMLAGTLLATAGAVGLAVPLGVLCAAWEGFYAPRALVAPYRRIMELLAGLPSVVFGFWGLVVLVPLVARLRAPGASLLAAALILALMILPTVALTAQASFRAVPRDYVLGAAALGVSRWATVRRVVLPAARSGVLTGVLLAIGRALGETMAVLMVAGNVVQLPASVFDPVRTLTANIALEMAYAVGVHRSALFVSGLLLTAMVVALIAAAERAIRTEIRV